METSIFMDLNNVPQNEDLREPLRDAYPLWMEIRDYVFEKYPKAVEEWKVWVKKYGWGYRIKDKKRAILYLSPKYGHIDVTFVFGQKAADSILASDIDQKLKDDLMSSKVYMEGRVLRIDVQDKSFMADIKKLIEIKIAN
jgi:hypothetical protein